MARSRWPTSTRAWSPGCSTSARPIGRKAHLPPLPPRLAGVSPCAPIVARWRHCRASGRRATLPAEARERAEFELESLQLTKGIEEAKVLLQDLQARQAGSVETADALSPAEIQAEIARLRALINEASERAAKNIERAAAARRT